MAEMRRIEVDPQRRVMVEGREGLSGGREIVGDLRQVDFEPEPNAFGAEDVQNRCPCFGDLLVTAGDVVEVVRREE